MSCRRSSSVTTVCPARMMAGVFGKMSALIWGVVMIFLYPSPIIPRIRRTEVSRSGEPSSIPGIRCECMSHRRLLRSEADAVFFLKKENITLDFRRLRQPGRKMRELRVGPSQTFFQGDGGLPSQLMQFGHIHQLPRRAIGFAQ